MTYIRHDQDDIINYDTFCPIPYKPIQKANKYGMMYVGKTKVGQGKTMKILTFERPKTMVKGILF